MTVLASLQKGQSLSKLEDATDERRSRQAISSFLTLAEWHAPKLLQQTALDQLQRLGFRSGDTVYLLLDDTQKRKRGKLMAADVIADLELPQGGWPIVLFDSYYLCFVLNAHLLLTHLALDAPDAKAKLTTRAPTFDCQAFPSSSRPCEVTCGITSWMTWRKTKPLAVPPRNSMR